ncbi:ABC transporter substrate-binding protein [Brevibacillus borstelensis]|uniref:ABC transporter substrate-binding protein n=1 Tax=Brevibacillus borstelensis TaxID=45462 RepID=UPI0030C469EC
MHYKEHFIRILLSLQATSEKGLVLPVTVEALAKALYCTPRNVKLILRRLAAEGLIEWRAGVGRGNVSRLTILRTLNETVEEYFHELLAKGRMKDAVDFISQKDLPVLLRDKLRGLLETKLGFQVEQTESSRLDVLRVTRHRKLASLDPAFVFSASEAYFLEQLCSTLVAFDPETKRFLPSLAHAWESNREWTVWTFYLRKGVRFHHGRTMTSRDVLHTLQRIWEVRSPSRWQYEDIERAEPVSDYAVTFHLRRPNRFFLHFFSSVTMSVLPWDVEFSERAIVGTGPFRMASCTDQVLVLEAFDDYFRERAWLDRVELWLIPDIGSSERQYQLPALEEVSTQEEHTGNQLAYQEFGCRFLIFNFRRPGIQHHPSFRKAMRLLFDRRLLLNQRKGSCAAPADSFLPEKSKRARYPETSLADAKALLDESGYAGETMRLYFCDKKEESENASWLQQRCEAIGLRLSLHSFDLHETLTRRLEDEADMIIAAEVLEKDVEWGLLRLFRDEGTFLHRFFHSEQHERLERHLRDFVRLPEEAERAQVIDQIEQLIREENWLLYGFHMQKKARYHPALKGLSIESFGWVDFSKLWIKR